MPIDTSIYSIPLNAPDPAGGLIKAIQLKGLIQQQQAQLENQQQARLVGAEQLKGMRSENQGREQAFSDDAAARKLFSGVQAGGAMPSDAQIYSTVGPTHGSTIVKALREADKFKVDLQKTKSEVAEKEADYSGGLAAMVKEAGYSPAAVQLAIQHAHSAGYEQEAQQLQELLSPENQGKIPALMDSLIANSPAQQKLISDRMTAQARTDQAATTKREADAKIPGMEADSTQKGLVTAGMVNPDDEEAQIKALTPEQRAQLKARADEISKLNSPSELAYKASDPKASPETRQAAREALKILERHAIASRPVTVQQFPAGLNPGQQAAAAQLTGEEYLKTLPPATAAQVKGIAEGRSIIPNGGSRSPAAQALRAAVFQYDPNFSEQAAQVRKAFATGTDGRNIGSLNTATVHLDQFSEAAKAMANGSFQPGNSAWNALRAMLGSSAPTNFAGLRTAVAGEMAAALKGTATDPEIADIKKTIDSKNSPQQLGDYVDEMLHVLGAKLNTYQERYRQQVPNDTTWSPVLPSARAVYAKHGLDPTAGPQRQSSGGSGHVIEMNGKHYRYNGTGSTADMKNYTEVTNVR